MDIKKAVIYNSIHCRGYILNNNVKNFIANLVSFVCNMKNYDVNKIKSVSVKIYETDNSMHLRIYFDEHISHIPITKPIVILPIKKKKFIDFAEKKNNNSIFS